jgi:hypothetical protein
MANSPIASLPADLLCILSTWEQGWRTLNGSLLESVWDTTYSHLVYVAEEQSEPLLGWQAIQDYYRDTLRIMEWFDVAFEPLRADILGNTAWMLSKGQWRGKKRDDDAQLGGTARISFLARWQEQNWAVIQYIEAPVKVTNMSSSLPFSSSSVV